MTEEDRWAHLVALDDELLLGGVILSEWSAFIVREADTAFAKGAHLASILVSVAAIETHLRSEAGQKHQARLVELIDEATIDQGLRADLHRLRRYRNKWVHVNEPQDDADVLEHPEVFERELEDVALFAARVLRRTIYSDQCV